MYMRTPYIPFDFSVNLKQLQKVIKSTNLKIKNILKVVK